MPLTSTSLLVQQGFSFSEGADKEDEVYENDEAKGIFEAAEEERKVFNDLGGWRGLEEEEAKQEEPLGELVVGKRKEEVVVDEDKIEVVKDDAGELVFLERADEAEVEEEKEDVRETDVVKTMENVAVENKVHLVGWLEVVQDGRVVKEVSPGDSVSLVARVGGLGAEQATLGECREEEGRQLTPHCGQVGRNFFSLRSFQITSYLNRWRASGPG